VSFTLVLLKRTEQFAAEAKSDAAILTSEEQERDAQAAACRRGKPRNELARLCIEPFTAGLRFCP
jgi:hypothetical protein